MAIDGKFTTVSEATTYLIQQGKVEELKGKSDADVLTLANRLAGEKEQSKDGITVEKEANPIPQTTAQAANAGAQAVPGGEQSENKASTNRLLSFEGSEAKVDKEAKKQRIQERTEEYKDLKDADGKTLGDNKNFWGVSKAKKLAKEATQEEIAKERVDRSRYYTTQKEYDEAVNADEKNENRHILLNSSDISLLEALAKTKKVEIYNKDKEGNNTTLNNDAVKEMLRSISGDNSLDPPQDKNMTDERGAAVNDAGLIDNRKNRKKMANFYEKMGFDVPDDNTVIRKLLPWLGAGLGAVGGGIAAYYDADKHPEHYAASGTVEGETEPTQTTYSGSSTYTGSTHYTGTVPHDEIQDGVTVAHYDIAYEGDVNYNGSVNYNGTIEVGPIPFSKDYQGELTDLGKAAVTTAGTGLGGAAGAGLGELAKLFFPVAEADQFKGKSAQDIIETGMTQNIKDPQAQALTGEILRVAKERGLDDEELIGAFKAGYGQQTGKVITVRELAGILDAVKVMEHAEKPSQGAIDNANKRADEAEQEAQDLKADIEEKDAEIENLQKQLKDCQDGEDCVGVVEEEPDAVPRTTLKISELPFRTGRWYLANGFVSADDKPLSQRDISNIMKYLRDNVAYEDNSRGRHTGIVLPNEITIGDKTFKLADDAVARINKLSARGGGNDPKYGKVSKNGSKWIFTDCDGSMQTFNTESEARAAQRKAHPNMK